MVRGENQRMDQQSEHFERRAHKEKEFNASRCEF